jgi:hypothetical protein
MCSEYAINRLYLERECVDEEQYMCSEYAINRLYLERECVDEQLE